MWAWFSCNVTEPVLFFLDNPLLSLWKEKGLYKMPNEWIFNIFFTVNCQRLCNFDIHLKAADYFPGLDAPDYRYSSHVGLKVLPHVEAVIIMWLQFRSRPGMCLETSRAVATFVSIASTAFASTDFLYLSCIQSRINKLRSCLTVQTVPLAEIPWGRLAKELGAHPLANPDSNDSKAASKLKDLLVTVSGLSGPDHIIPQEMAKKYKAAVGMGGDEGVALFSDCATLPCPMQVFISLRVSCS